MADAAPAPFDRAAFAAHLTTRRLGRPLIVRAEAGSTNDVAWEALAAGAPEGTTVVADAQTRGRGRGGRGWHTAPGRGLALSVIAFPGCDLRHAGVVPLLAGLALARALETQGARTALKWPNDLTLDGRKLAGILCESRGAGAVDALVIGVGVNVSQTSDHFPDALRAAATSLALAGVTASREAVAAAFLGALEDQLEALERAGAPPLLEAWRARATFWGEAVRVRAPGGELRGIARTLDERGALVLALADGREVAVLAGDVEAA